MSFTMPTDERVAEALNSINRANMIGVVPDHMWTNLLDEYFTMDRGTINEDKSEIDSDSDLDQDSDEESTGDDPLIEVDPTIPVMEEVGREIVEDEDVECEKVLNFRCKCKLNNKGPCSKLFSTEEIMNRRLDMHEHTEAEKDLILLGIVSVLTDYSEMTSTAKKGPSGIHDRKRPKNHFFVGSKKICRDMFLFMYAISRNKFSAVTKSFKENGLSSRKKQVSRTNNIRSLSLPDVQRLVAFVNSYAEDHALVLPGRVSSHARDDIRLLPSSITKADIYQLYKTAMENAGERAVADSTFRSLWIQLLPRIVLSRPMTDLCWECQKNHRDISRTSNLPEIVKAAKLLKQQKHLECVQIERRVYQQMVEHTREAYKDQNVALGPHPTCSRQTIGHYSFDYAQQVHLPHDPLQPGPLYFLCPRKVGLFGVCCEGIPQQVNYIIDEAHCSSKGSNAVISYLHHFFSSYALGEENIDLHCDNCSGQNKNNHMLAYLMWRVMTRKHHQISLNFLIAGHTKFAPDWCFGLLKQKHRRTPASSLQEFAKSVEGSTSTRVNIAQLVGTEKGEDHVPMYDWHSHLSSKFKTLPGIKQYHHFRFTADEPGVVYAKEYAGSEEVKFSLLKAGPHSIPREDPTPQPSPGLPDQRQWYLFNSIREFCTPETQDLMCPKPSAVEPAQLEGNDPKERAVSRGRGHGQDHGRGRSRGRGQGCGQGRGRGKCLGRGRGSIRDLSPEERTMRNNRGKRQRKS